MKAHRKKNEKRFGSGWVTTLLFVGAIGVAFSFGHIACHADCSMRDASDSKNLYAARGDVTVENDASTEILQLHVNDLELKLKAASQELAILKDAKQSQASEIERLYEKLRAKESVEVLEADDSLLEHKSEPEGRSSTGVIKISGPVKGTKWSSIRTFDQRSFHEVLGFPYQHASNNAVLFEKKTGCSEVLVVVTGKKPNTCVAVLERTFPLPEIMKLALPEGLRWGKSSSMESIPWAKPGFVDLYPRRTHRENALGKLGILLSHYEEMKAELKPILTRISRFLKKTIVVMCLNQGNLDLVFNFVCSCRNHNININNLLVFAADELTFKTLKTFGVESYWHEGLGKFPSTAARAYGDATFVSLMWLKVVSVFLVNDLGFNQIFQDADVVWFRDPVQYFANRSSEIDTFWQDDGARSNRFSPFFANSGFYYVRATEPAKHFIYNLLVSFHEIMAVRSHQHILDRLLFTHKAHYGLGIEVLDKADFPQGQVFHHNKPLMKQFVTAERKPYIFHMCWTANKNDKLKYMKQVGLWFLEPKCDINFLSNASGGSKVKSCCEKNAKAWRPYGPGKLPNLSS